MLIKYNNSLLFVHSNIPYDEDYINVDLYPTNDIYKNIPLLFCRFYTKGHHKPKIKEDLYIFKIPFYCFYKSEKIETFIFLSSISPKIIISDKKRFRETVLKNNKFINYFKDINNKWKLFVNHLIETQPPSPL